MLRIERLELESVSASCRSLNFVSIRETRSAAKELNVHPSDTYRRIWIISITMKSGKPADNIRQD